MLHPQSKFREDLPVSTLEADAPTSHDPFGGLFADSTSDSCAVGRSDAEQVHHHPHPGTSPEDEDPLFALATEDPIPDPPPAALSHEVNQALARLEMNSLQVKLYLDSIEERIRRMEPRLEQIHEEQQTQTEAPPRTSEPKVEPVADGLSEESASALPSILLPVASTTDRRRRRLDIPPPASIEQEAPLYGADHLPDEDLWALKPWLLARRKQFAVAGTVVLAFVTILTFGAGDHRISPALPAGTPAAAPLGSSAIPKASAGTPIPPTRDLQLPAVADPQLAANSPQTSGTPASPATSLPAPPSAVSSAPGQPITAGISSSPAASVHDGRAPGAKPSASVLGAPTPGSVVPASGRVRVSSGVMAGNLLFSPTPKYPGGFATLFHMEGHVTMQAIIARNGTVDDLRVLSGHRLLRGAAQEAVRTWRYRPYLLNGVPVEVATIVTVEFHR